MRRSWRAITIHVLCIGTAVTAAGLARQDRTLTVLGVVATAMAAWTLS